MPGILVSKPFFGFEVLCLIIFHQAGKNKGKKNVGNFLFLLGGNRKLLYELSWAVVFSVFGN